MTAKTTQLRDTLVRTIARDERVLSCDLLRNLCHLLRDILDNLLLGGPRLDILALQDSVEQIVHASRASHRTLNNARITTRGTIRPDIADHDVPEPARPFLRLGTYLGTFDSLGALAVQFGGLASTPSTSGERRDLTGAGIDLHLHRVVWTIDLGEQLHVFRPHPDDSGDPDRTTSGG